MQKKLTQAEFATAIGRSRQWYRDVKRTQNMKVNDLVEIAKSLDISPAYFFATNYKTPDQVSLLNEPNLNRIENMKQLIDAQSEIIAMQKEKISDLKLRLAAFENDKVISSTRNG